MHTHQGEEQSLSKASHRSRRRSCSPSTVRSFRPPFASSQAQAAGDVGFLRRPLQHISESTARRGRLMQDRKGVSGPSPVGREGGDGEGRGMMEMQILRARDLGTMGQCNSYMRFVRVMALRFGRD